MNQLGGEVNRRKQTAPKGLPTAFAMPPYIMAQLRSLAIGHNTGLRGVTLTALQLIGVYVDPIDLEQEERLARPTGYGPQAGLAFPLYVMNQLRALAIRQRCTMRFLVLHALQAYGLDIEPADLIADKRQSRIRGTRTNYARKASGKNHRT